MNKPKRYNSNPKTHHLFHKSIRISALTFAYLTFQLGVMFYIIQFQNFFMFLFTTLVTMVSLLLAWYAYEEEKFYSEINELTTHHQQQHISQILKS